MFWTHMLGAAREGSAESWGTGRSTTRTCRDITRDLTKSRNRGHRRRLAEEDHATGSDRGSGDLAAGSLWGKRRLDGAPRTRGGRDSNAADGAGPGWPEAAAHPTTPGRRATRARRTEHHGG